MKKITLKKIAEFEEFLRIEEKSVLTTEKYIRDIKAFYLWANEINKLVVLSYKEYLAKKYAPASVNSILSSLNSFFNFCGWHELRVKRLKIQRQIFAEKDKELTKLEYERLLRAANVKKNKRLYLLMQAICSCGLRVSELRFITVEAVKKQKMQIKCKCKIRQVFLPKDLCKSLERYIKEQKIKSGSVFITKSGKPLNRSNIWADMKKLCQLADVLPSKIFPHNLRHLFARTFYSIQKDIVRLADILGHSSVNTTRIYTMEAV